MRSHKALKIVATVFGFYGSVAGCSAEDDAGALQTASAAVVVAGAPAAALASRIGLEVAVPVHLQDGQEFQLGLPALVSFGEQLFVARWTGQEGQGRPFGKGNDQRLTDPTSPLAFPHNFNRISGPVAGSCAGCHNEPRPGGGGDIVGNVFVAGNRFDFATFDLSDTVPIRGAVDEIGNVVTWQTIANSRKTIGMFGSGYVEMLARQMTVALQAEAAACGAGHRCTLAAKGVRFGSIVHNADGTWNTSDVEGIAAPSLVTDGPTPPSLILRTLFQAGHEISIREFSVNSLIRLHGIQAEERFGVGVDQDGDGFVNEVTRADVTALALFQATLPVPGRVIPNDPEVQAAIFTGETLFSAIGCARCHVPTLPLTNEGWIYSEPNPFNDAGNLRVTDGVPSLSADLTDPLLPTPRLVPLGGVIQVPAYTDLKLHDITTGRPSCGAHPELIATGACDGDVEPLDQNQPTGSTAFFAGNRYFITRKLWGIANQHAYGHHGQYTTMREAVLAHNGEAADVKARFLALGGSRQAAVIEFLKSLQILPAGVPCRVVDDNYRCRSGAGGD